MKQIVECVANFSEGRRQDVIAKIVAAIGAIDRIQVLGVESDIDHHRSVVTFIGAPRDVLRAAFEGIRVASSLIDLKLHRGQHPRIGAADVIPFVPLRNVNMADCVELARSLGQRVGEELRLPVFLYAEAALQEANRDIAAIRRGGYEALKNSIATRRPPQPDFGPRRLGRAGGCIIGARPILIAFNVYLNTADLKIAKRIAGRIRESSGGMPHVKGLGLFVKGKAQVSMNLTNYQVTSMRAVLERIRQEAQGDGVQIDESEVIGLIPRDALAGGSARQLQIANFGPERILEYHLDDAR
ncbi:MAG: glutamate formimidoyltransferase [Chloroflexota bacterium]|nr:glutamate formimidoyltransferase [Chloroflexota bacterium]MDE2948283.1 glutamate formimidoyltransferase [Chloroflexota bacterium]